MAPPAAHRGTRSLTGRYDPLVMLRRKRIPTELRAAHDAFEAQAQRVEEARTALLSCLPTGRVARAPVPVGLELLRDELREVREVLEDWRVPAIEERWQACARAVDLALERIPESLAQVEETDEGDVVLSAVARVVGPLDAWATAERAWRRLRV